MDTFVRIVIQHGHGTLRQIIRNSPDAERYITQELSLIREGNVVEIVLGNERDEMRITW